MRGLSFGQPPQDEWHQRVLALEEGLRQRCGRGPFGTSRTAHPPLCRSQHGCFSMRRHALRIMAVGAGITALLVVLW